MAKTQVALRGASILVTGAAGFIGAALCEKLCQEYPESTVVGFDSVNDYYDTRLKNARLTRLHRFTNFRFIKGDLVDKGLVDRVMAEVRPHIVVNLAAQAGVRYSIMHPEAYIDSNVIGFFNVLEACRHALPEEGGNLQHLVYASSSSVYGANTKSPYSTEDQVDHPVSLYAATKKSNELFAHAYAKLFNIPSTGLRFFTVYGPEGRPDMAYFSFAEHMVRDEKIRIFNYGYCMRDFTYIDDIVEGIHLVMQKAPAKEMGEDALPIPPYALYNIGCGKPSHLLDFVQILKEELVNAGVLPHTFDLPSHMELVPMQPGDVPKTFADTDALMQDFGYRPSTDLRTGLRHFAEWYKQYTA